MNDLKNRLKSEVNSVNIADRPYSDARRESQTNQNNNQKTRFVWQHDFGSSDGNFFFFFQITTTTVVGQDGETGRIVTVMNCCLLSSDDDGPAAFFCAHVSSKCREIARPRAV